jgi:PmbA protein
MSKERIDALIALGQQVVELATRHGAEVAEVLATEGAELSAKVRMGETELVQEASPRGLGLRVIVGGRAGSSHSSDLSPRGLEQLARDAVELAELSQPDPFNAPPDAGLLARHLPELELHDPEVAGLDARGAIERARAGEAAALAHDPRIVNSEGATCGRDLGAIALVTSGGFAGGYARSSCSIVVSPVAKEGEAKMQTGYHWDARRHLAALAAPDTIGVEAARRTLAKLGATKIPSCEAPVVFHPDAGRALLSALFSCFEGHAIYRRTSYLVDREGDRVASPIVTIVDDPLIPRGPASRPFDGEGLASRRNVVVEDGILRTYLLDSYSARKLGRESTASARRGLGGSPSVGATNLQLVPGEQSPEALIADTRRGLYVTSMMGFGFNAVTGDFSRGAEGFWIENGELTRPVGEITISLGFDELWKSIDAVASDLDLRTGVATPTFRVAKMTIAGT